MGHYSNLKNFTLPKNMDSEVTTALKSIDINSEKAPTCDLCGAENPTKKCEKTFCKKTREAKEEEAKTEEAPSKENEEEIRRKEELDAVAKAEKAKLKKAEKMANKDKSKGDGAFWWNNSVYAS